MTRAQMLACAGLLAILATPPTASAAMREEFDGACLDALTMDGMMGNESGHASMNDTLAVDCDAPVPPGYENATPDEFERMYLRRMILHHAGAVTMGEIAIDKAHRPELRALAQNMTTQQHDEIAQMTDWLRTWHNFTPPDPNQTGMMHHMTPQMANLTNLSGEAFDRAFLDVMIAHHLAAVNASEAAKQRVAHNDVRILADDIVLAQTQEVETMRAWRDDGAEESTRDETPALAVGAVLAAMAGVAWARRRV